MLNQNIRRYLAPLIDHVNAARHSTTSYSQFGEDAVVHSLINRLKYEGSKDYSPSRKIYIDVGANKPKMHSNSYFLYRQGWHGILVEPFPVSSLSFKLNRPRDYLARCCAGQSAGSVTLYHWGPNSVFNSVNREFAEATAARIGRPFDTIEAPMLPLPDIAAKAGLRLSDVGALFVDVEGHEMSVLQCLAGCHNPPDFVVVEIMTNTITAVLASDVHNFLEKIGYRFIGWPNPSAIYLRKDLAEQLIHLD
jgi:FkbM family methyltransferase